MDEFPGYQGDIPSITTEQMIEVDRAMMEDYRIDLSQMMENAGRSLAHLARRRFLAGNPEGRQVVVLAGPGGNGGGALVCARRLHNYGAHVWVAISRPAEAFTPISAHQLDILRRMDVTVVQADSIAQIAPPDLIIDGLIGYSLRGAPRGDTAHLIHWANGQQASILALDVPSGMDPTTGSIHDPAIRAAATLTLALPKAGLMLDSTRQQVGELYLADISVPPELYRRPPFELEVGHPFAESDIIRLY